MKFCFRAIISLSVLFLSFNAGLHAQESQEVAWLVKNALEFDTAEAGHGFDDLRNVGKIRHLHADG